jgi:DNA end-binding protein Ku
VAETDGSEVPFDSIVKGSQVEKDRYVVFSNEELAEIMKGASGGIADVVQFPEQAEIDPIHYKKSYYLAPEETGIKAYRILHDAPARKDVVGIARVAIRDKEQMATLRAEEDVLVLETMFSPNEIREPRFEQLDKKIEIRAEEVAMAEMIIDNLTRVFEPDAWHDESREAVEEAARKKIEREEIVAAEPPKAAGVLDLMEALKASVETTKQRKTG